MIKQTIGWGTPLPHGLLGIGLAFLLLSLFAWKATLDIHLHDTYYVVAVTHILVLLGWFFGFLWLLYVASRKILWLKSLTRLHVSLTLLSFAGIAAAVYAADRAYVDLSSFSIRSGLLLLFLVCFTVAQALFVINIIGGSLKRLI